MYNFSSVIFLAEIDHRRDAINLRICQENLTETLPDLSLHHNLSLY